MKLNILLVRWVPYGSRPIYLWHCFILHAANPKYGTYLFVQVMYRALLDASKLKSGNDAEMTLRFLKTAIFYFLTDMTNSRDHLAAIESILGFSEDEKAKIEKIHGCKYRIS